MAKTLSVAIKEFTKELEGVRDSLTSAYQNTLYDVGNTLVYYTPIDTGYASSNWNVSSGDRVESEREPEKGIKGAASLLAIQKQVKGLEKEPFALFYNPVDYIGDLNGDNGPPTSRQAPTGITVPTTSKIQDIWEMNLTKFNIKK